jgi:hypothetical protein
VIAKTYQLEKAARQFTLAGCAPINHPKKLRFRQ